MVHIIETNISYNDDSSFADFQSRIIEEQDWHEYVYEIRNQLSRNKNGTLIGLNLPRKVEVFNLKFDDDHLSCDFYNPMGKLMKKLAYVTDLKRMR